MKYKSESEKKKEVAKLEKTDEIQENEKRMKYRKMKKKEQNMDKVNTN